MTANQDLYAAAQAAIETRRALVAAGTPGPWGTKNLGPYQMVTRPDLNAVAVLGIGSIDSSADAALIVAAVNGYPLLLGMVEHRLHAPDEHEPDFCESCLDQYGSRADWPCPDALAALTALGVAPC